MDKQENKKKKNGGKHKKDGKQVHVVLKKTNMQEKKEISLLREKR